MQKVSNLKKILKRDWPSGLTLELGWWHGIWPHFPTWGSGGTSDPVKLGVGDPFVFFLR